jgi:hypothetical protein
VADALDKIDRELERQARVAYADAALEDEKRRAAAAAEELDRLAQRQYRCAV